MTITGREKGRRAETTELRAVRQETKRRQSETVLIWSFSDSAAGPSSTLKPHISEIKRFLNTTCGFSDISHPSVPYWQELYKRHSWETFLDILRFLDRYSNA